MSAFGHERTLRGFSMMSASSRGQLLTRSHRYLRAKNPLWVIGGHGSNSERCPLCPPESGHVIALNKAR